MSDKSVNPVKVKVAYFVIACPVCGTDNRLLEDPRGTSHPCHACGEKFEIDTDAKLRMVF